MTRAEGGVKPLHTVKKGDFAMAYAIIAAKSAALQKVCARVFCGDLAR
jgi:hypothetical protein